MTDKELFGNSEQLNDTISRQAAVDALDKRFDSIPMEQTSEILLLRKDLREMPPIQPDKDKVSNLLYHIYSIQSPHLDVSGVVAKKYYCEELWEELFGKESELPRWMT